MKIDKNYPQLHYDDVTFYKDEDTGEEIAVKKYKIADDIISDEDIEIDLDAKVMILGKIESKGNIISDSSLTVTSGIYAKGDLFLKNPNEYTDWKISTPLLNDIYVGGNIITDGDISCGGKLFCAGNIKSKNNLYSYGDITSKSAIEVSENIIVDGNISCNHLLFGNKAYMSKLFKGKSFWSNRNGSLIECVEAEKLNKALSSDDDYSDKLRFKYKFDDCSFGEQLENEKEDYGMEM